MYVLSWLDDLVIAGSNVEDTVELGKLFKENLGRTIDENPNGS